MYTRILRMLVKLQRRVAGHCDDTGSGSGSGHCY